VQDFLSLLRDLARASFVPVLVVLVAFATAVVASIGTGVLLAVILQFAGPPERHGWDGEAVGMAMALLITAVFFSVFVVACGLGWFIVHRRRKGSRQ
jgi:hypothetical protein